MGNWNISIDGTGSHHNRSEGDVNVLVDKFVKELSKAGQNVERVCLTYGARQLYFGEDDGWHPYPQDVTAPGPTQVHGSS